METKSFALIERDNSDFPVIGVIANIPDTPLGASHFKSKFIRAVTCHYDSDFNYNELPYLFDLNHPHEVGIEIDGMNYFIEIIETWIY